MIPWTKIIHVGDTAIMIPAAAAIMAYLVTGRAWRMAWLWCLLFSLGISLVAATKIAFLGWGSGIHSVNFKALSGHATSTTAVIPVIFYLLLQRFPPIIRTCGILLGIVFGVVMGILLVMLHEHSASEAAAGCVIGGIISIGFIWLSDTLPSSPNPWLIPISVLAFLAVWYAELSSIEYWMVRVALYLSGHEQPYNWTTWELGT
jgi:hypothetical protein